MTCVFCIDDDTIIWLFVCADVGPRVCEVELLRVSAPQEPSRPPRGGPWSRERHQCEDTEARLAENERATRRHRFDDPGDRPSHAPPADAEGDFEDICCRLEVVLQGVPKGMWLRIQDEGILEQCEGVSMTWWVMVR
jgi:hypothetical protein